jgi:hypothetical protein
VPRAPEKGGDVFRSMVAAAGIAAALAVAPVPASADIVVQRCQIERGGATFLGLRIDLLGTLHELVAGEHGLTATILSSRSAIDAYIRNAFSLVPRNRPVSVSMSCGGGPPAIAESSGESSETNFDITTPVTPPTPPTPPTPAGCTDSCECDNSCQ